MRIALALVILGACGADSTVGDQPDAPSGDGATTSDAALPDGTPAFVPTIFVIPMENKPTSAIYGNTTDAPYINGLFASAARATKFGDALPALPSEPHYVWMEAGTNAFTDRTFINDDDPTATNTTSSPDHLVTQLTAAGVSWTSYQEGITSGTCPIHSAGHYAAKHDPFVFFKDVVGATPSTTAPGCAAHHRAYADFAADLAAGLTGYIFITPDVCHDMHGAGDCPSGTGSAANIKAGDTWLSTELPRIIAYAQTHDAIIFLVWDEGDSSNVVPFLALGSRVTAGATSSLSYTHGSLVKSVEGLLGLPVLPAVAAEHDFADMFAPGTFH